MDHKRFYDSIIIAVLLLFLAAPVASIFALGIPKPYGQKPYSPIQVGVSKLLGDSGKPRAALTLALLERSPVRRWAIKTTNWLNYSVFGFVDTPLIVSGRGGWLFYKSQFWGGKCMSDFWFTSTLDRVDLMQGLATAAGLDVRFSVAPDKFSIYPEQLHPRAAAYANCRVRNGQRWRALAAQRAPLLLDHTRSLLVEKANREKRGDKHLLYYQTDTHWNRSVTPAVVADIATQLPGHKLSAEPAFVDWGENNVDTDLRNSMLLLDHRETVASGRGAFPIIPTKAVVLHDSFYMKLRPLLMASLRGAQFFHYLRDEKSHTPLVRKSAGPILINAVERSFFIRFRDPISAPLAQVILRRNMDAAARCQFPEDGPTSRIEKSVNIVASREGYTAISPQPHLFVRNLMPQLRCLRLSLTLPIEGRFEVFLPSRQLRQSSALFEPGRSFALPLKAGSHELRFILPEGLQSDTIRIHPTNKKSNFILKDIRFGSPAG